MTSSQDQLLQAIAVHSEGIGFNQLYKEMSHVVSKPTLLKRLDDYQQQGLVHWTKGRRGQRSLIRLTDTMKEIAEYQTELQDLVAFCTGYVDFIIRKAVEEPFPKDYTRLLKQLARGAPMGAEEEGLLVHYDIMIQGCRMLRVLGTEGTEDDEEEYVMIERYREKLAKLEKQLGKKIAPEEFVRVLAEEWALNECAYAFPYLIHEFAMKRAIPFSLKYPQAAGQVFPLLVGAYTKVSESMLQSLRLLRPVGPLGEDFAVVIHQDGPVAHATLARDLDSTLREATALGSQEAGRLLELYARMDKWRKPASTITLRSQATRAGATVGAERAMFR